MNSHKTIPKSTLKRFADPKTKMFSYYDIKRKEIRDYAPKSYNTEEGYYSSEFEDWLGRYVEKPMGDLNKALDCFIEAKDNFNGDFDKIKKDLITFIAAQSVRMPSTMEYVMETEHKNVLINKCLSDIARRGKLDAEVIYRADKYRKEMVSDESKRVVFYNVETITKVIKRLNKRLADYTVDFAIIDEKTNASFIITPMHFFSVGNRIIVPCSPRFAFILRPKEDQERNYLAEDNNELVQRWISIDDEDLLLFLPHCINAIELYEPQHVIADKSYLQKLIAGKHLN